MIQGNDNLFKTEINDDNDFKSVTFVFQENETAQMVIAFIDLTASVLSGGKEKTRDKYNRNENATLKAKSQLGTYRTPWIFNLRSVSMEGWN
ncbi:unnamed protein product [Rhizophagus irregularis]|nr:unnamed protein product [Rhizophagus irregularis]